MPLRAGAADAVITPALGTWLSGFGPRDTPADATHDDLRCGALYLEDAGSGTCLAILSLDLVGLPVPLARAWRRTLGARTGIPPEHILISCTHTHSGPVTGMLWDYADLGDRERAYLAHLEHVLAGALEAAVSRARAATLSAARGAARTQFNRRDPLGGQPGPLDDSVGTLLIRDASLPDAPPIAALVSYACHPTGITGQNRGFSADYPGWVRRTVGDALGCPVLFLQAAGADHNTLSRTGPHAARDTTTQLAAARAQGAAIGGVALRLLLTSAPGEDSPLSTTTHTVSVPLAPLPPLAELEGALATLEREATQLESSGTPQDAAAARERRRQSRWPSAMVELLRHGTGPLAPHPERAGAGATGALDLEIQALRLGPVALVALPVEPFSAIGLALREMRDGRGVDVWCAGYANGVYGYLAPAEEYPRGGYELIQAYRYYRQPAPFAPESAELVLAHSRALLDSVAPPNLS